MNNPQLVSPDIKYEKTFLNGYMDFGIEEKYYGLYTFEQVSSDFETFVKNLNDFTKGENLPKGWVPDSQFWLIDNDEYIGRVDIRHRLDANLEKFGGHVGYEICPRFRKQGYGHFIMNAVQAECMKLGLERILLTCYEDNYPSIKIIEKAGAVLQDTIHNEGHPKPTCRYWLQLEK